MIDWLKDLINPYRHWEKTVRKILSGELIIHGGLAVKREDVENGRVILG